MKGWKIKSWKRINEFHRVDTSFKTTPQQEILGTH